MRFVQSLLVLSALLGTTVQATESETLSTIAAAYQTAPREYRLDGVVEAVNQTTVSAQTSGQVQMVDFDVDDFVQQGAIVARIRDTEHRAQVTQAAAGLKSAAARLQQAREEHERIEGLYQRKNVSDSARDQAVADLAAAQAGLESATAQLEQAQEQLGYTEIRAPYSGIVTARHVEVGETVAPGQPVISGISLDQLRVIVDVPQSVIPRVREGALARVYLDDGDVIESERLTIFPFADLGSNSFKVRIDLPSHTPDLFPGMFVKTGFTVGEKQELVVPVAALVRRSELTGVYVVASDGAVSLRQIRPGRRIGDQVAVLAGLSAGERIALDPIQAGVALKEQAAARRAAAERDHG